MALLMPPGDGNKAHMDVYALAKSAVCDASCIGRPRNAETAGDCAREMGSQEERAGPLEDRVWEWCRGSTGSPKDEAGERGFLACTHSQRLPITSRQRTYQPSERRDCTNACSDRRMMKLELMNKSQRQRPFHLKIREVSWNNLSERGNTNLKW